MQLGHQLHPVSGRLWIRSARAEPRGDNAFDSDRDARTERLKDALMLIGVVEVPKSADVERMHDVRLNDHLWLDIDQARKPRTHWPEMVREQDVGGILTDLSYAAGFLPDSFEVFLRSTMLKHDDPSKRWAFIIAALPRRLEALPKDGLYEFDSKTKGFRLVNTELFIGEPPSSVLNAAQWGPDGKYGFSTSLEPTHFPAWLAAERESQRTKSYIDPRFPLFAHLVKERSGDEMVHTAEQLQAHKKVCDTVMREIMAMSEEELAAATAQLPPPRAAAAATPARRMRP